MARERGNLDGNPEAQSYLAVFDAYLAASVADRDDLPVAALKEIVLEDLLDRRQQA